MFVAFSIGTLLYEKEVKVIDIFKFGSEAVSLNEIRSNKQILSFPSD